MSKQEILKNILNVSFPFSGNVEIDSRNLKKGDIFIAIRKGNDYVKNAIEIGAFPIYEIGDYEEGIKVEDSILFIQELARKYREKLSATIIGVTGSNGKTTVKDILANLLDATKTQANYNNHIGLPFTILNCPLEAKYLVLEMGMSAEKEIDLLASIAKPDYSIITNIGDSHLEYLKTRENVFKAKSEIIPHTSKKVFVNAEDEYLKTLKNVEKISISDVSVFDEGTKFKLYNNEYTINLYGEHNALDAALAIAVTKEIKRQKLINLEITKMRFQIINLKDNIIINDAYNAAPKSMESSLLTLDKIYKGKDKYIVLGDMLELGEKEVEYHREISKVLEKIEYKKAYLYGNLMKNVEAKNIYHTMNKEEIKAELSKISNSVIFLKGSRGMKLEEIIGSE